MDEKEQEEDVIKLKTDAQHAEEVEAFGTERRAFVIAETDQKTNNELAEVMDRMKRECAQLRKERDGMKRECAQLQKEKERLQNEIQILHKEKRALKISTGVNGKKRVVRSSPENRNVYNQNVLNGISSCRRWTSLKWQQRKESPTRILEKHTLGSRITQRYETRTKSHSKTLGKGKQTKHANLPDIKIEGNKLSAENMTDMPTSDKIRYENNPPKDEILGRPTKRELRDSDSSGDRDDDGTEMFSSAGAEDEELEGLETVFDCPPLPGGPHSSSFVKAEEGEEDDRKEERFVDGFLCQIDTGCPENPVSASQIPRETSKAFSIQMDFLHRTRRHSHGKKLHQCPECADKLANKKQLRLHMMRKHSKTARSQHRCGHCPLTFQSAAALRKHIRISHNNIKVDADAKDVRCRQCGETFTRAADLTMHIRVDHTDRKPFQCSECSATFSSRGNLTVHLKKHGGQKPFRCAECDATFSRATDLKSHVRRHSMVKPHACSLCPASFCRAGDLKPHMRTHTGERPFQCEVCGAAFSTSSNLAVHRRIHTRERPFQCEKCGDSFSQLGHLTRHRLKHTTENNFQCTSCPKSFGNAYHLKVHMQRHNTDNAFKCKDCGAAFSRASILTEHIRIHTGDKPFKCDRCPATFARQTNLKAHQRKHTGERPYVCPHCKQGFTQSTSLNRHLQSKKACQARQGITSQSETAGDRTQNENGDGGNGTPVKGDKGERESSFVERLGTGSLPSSEDGTAVLKQDISVAANSFMDTPAGASASLCANNPGQVVSSVVLGSGSEAGSSNSKATGMRTSPIAGHQYGYTESGKSGSHQLLSVRGVANSSLFSESAISASSSANRPGSVCATKTTVTSGNYPLMESSEDSMLLPTITMDTDFPTGVSEANSCQVSRGDLAPSSCYFHGNLSIPSSSQLQLTHGQLHHQQ